VEKSWFSTLIFQLENQANGFKEREKDMEIRNFIVANWLTCTLGILALAVIILALILVSRTQVEVNIKNILQSVRNRIKSILTWNWTKKLLHWIIISAGTMSECVFLIASLWVSINANVHTFVLLFISEDTTTHLTELATTAYVALPECIVGLAVVVTLSHIRVVMYNHKDYRAIIWSILYGLPTIVFLVLSLITLGSAVASVNFQMPTPLVVVRALAGYTFAFTSLLYTQLGEPQEKDRLAKKDALLEELRSRMEKMIAQLRQENATNLSNLRQQKDDVIAKLLQEKDAIVTQFHQERNNANQKIAELNERLSAHQKREEDLVKTIHKSEESSLQAYSSECREWLSSGVKTVSLDEISHYTGHSKRKIDNAITAGNIQTAPRNKKLILVSSLVEWLKNTPSPTTKNERDTGPMLHVVNG
jgi:hypothetical protein